MSDLAYPLESAIEEDDLEPNAIGIPSSVIRRASSRASRSASVRALQGLKDDSSAGRSTSTGVGRDSPSVAPMPLIEMVSETKRVLSRMTPPLEEVAGHPPPTYPPSQVDAESQSLPPNNSTVPVDEDDPRLHGTLKSLKGSLVMVIISASQLLDNISMTSVSMSLPAISQELNIREVDQQWLISAYTLTFGGFLLLAGVISDRWGKKPVFVAGMAWLSLWTLADGFAKTEIQLIIFRAMQGFGAAATVPSSVGIISSFFVGRERNIALLIFGSAGAVGFVLGLIYGGVLTTVLGWRWVFWLACPIGSAVAAAGYFILPSENIRRAGPRAALDYWGAALATSGMILLTFVISSGGVYGWGKAFVIALLILGVALIAAFAFAETKVENPLVPAHLWKLPGFAITWIIGLCIYMWWQSFVLYLTLISQNVLGLSPLQTAIRLIPMGPCSLGAAFAVEWGLNRFTLKTLLIFGMVLSVVAGIPTATMTQRSTFWSTVFPSSILGVLGISVVYNVLSVSMMASVPPRVKSMTGGLINTAFQLGSGMGLAICAAVITQVPEGLLSGYKAALWVDAGFCGIGLLLATFGMKNHRLAVGE